ncbi:MAG: polysaccharide biosynthesis tyrosine autokinase [Chromatiaceae bacterium]|nr:MAG: polysaccharide biosynthesis tyrosine autokinase [Chromatiaceae bacterium]
MQDNVSYRPTVADRAPPEPISTPFFGQESEDEGTGIGEYIAALFQYKWLILLLTALGFAVGYANYFRAVPQYQASALIQVERRSSGFTGDFLGSLAQYQPVFADFLNIPAEVVLMRSRESMRSVMHDLNLDIQAQPLYYPHIGEPIARRFRGSGVAKPWFGRDEYAWGGERIEVDALDVPDRLRGVGFVLVAGSDGHFRLFRGAEEILAGQVGERAVGQVGDDAVAIFVTRLRARPGTQFRVARLPEGSVIGRLQSRFSARESPPGTGIMQVQFSGTDPAEITKIVNAIVGNYQRGNVERRSAQADKTLTYLETQLPQLRERLEAAKAAYNSYRLEHGSLDIDREMRNVLDSMVNIESSLGAIAQEREQLRQLYTPEHPKIQSLDRSAVRLSAQLQDTEQRMKRLPDTQQRILGLRRDVEVNNRLYSELVNSLQGLRIAKAGMVGNVHVIDEALPPGGPYAPNRNRIIATYTGGGLLLGLGLVFGLVQLRNKVESPEPIEQQLRLPVYASIPHSDQQDKRTKRTKKGKQSQAFVLATELPDDPVVETFRSLRTSLHFMTLESDSNVVLITGPREGVGKSFVALNLAAVLAQSDKQVLLIDADLRRGHLNRYFGVDKEPGLADYIVGQIELADAIRPTGIPGLGFIPTGKRPPNPSELLMANCFSALLAHGSNDYDYVIVDAPPVMAVADAGIIGMLVGATLLVARAGQHHISELDATVKQLNQSGAKVRGFVLNDVRTFRGYGYGYRYGYRYSYKKYAYKYGYNPKGAA